MTICNKIQTVGETMETNLNARGVSCTFGTGTGESTVLDMVEMVNGTNFRGSSDVNLKIGANRPYLLENETTDVVVKLEDGLCEPLKNKNVIVGQSVFRDGGVTGNTNSSWYKNSGTDNRTVTATGTTLANTTSTRYDIFAYFGTAYDIYLFQSPFTVEFDVVNYTVSGSNRAKMQIYDKDTNVQYNVVDGVGHWKIVCDGTTCMTYKDGVKINEESKNIQKARVGFYIQQNCSITYKNFVIYETIDGVTDEKGEFALYDVEVSSDTIFTATYGTETATTNVYLCQFVDYGITSNNNLGQWYYAPSYTSASVDTSGKTFTAIREGSFATVSATLTQNPTSTDIYPYSFPLTIEFDLIGWEDNQGTTTDYARIRAYNQANNKIVYWNVKDYGVGHYKIVCKEGTQKLYFNGVEQSRSFTFTPTTDWNVAFQSKGYIKFHNFAIY